jgi:hypothetical protein
MPKTKFVRVATSGPTIDGRNIDPAQLEQMAQTYDPVTYTARINLEHFRGVTGQPPFQTGGDVLALKTEPIELNVGGKTEKRTALLAELDVNDAFVALNKQDQKVFSSVEILSNFAGGDKAYLAGLAFTDSPASLGTERLHFTAHAKAYGNLVSSPTEVKLEYSDASKAEDEAAKLRAGITDFFKNLFPATNKPADPPATFTPPPVATPPAAPQSVQFDYAAFTKSISDGFAKVAEVIDANQKATDARITQFEQNFNALKTQLETTESTNHTARPPATGGNGDVQTDF